MTELLGWTATAVFVASYFFRRPELLRRLQVAGAVIWVLYGVLMHAAPVVAANLLVMAAAAWTARRGQAATDNGISPQSHRGAQRRGDGVAAAGVRRNRRQPAAAGQK